MKKCEIFPSLSCVKIKEITLGSLIINIRNKGGNAYLKLQIQPTIVAPTTENNNILSLNYIAYYFHCHNWLAIQSIMRANYMFYPFADSFSPDYISF